MNFPFSLRSAGRFAITILAVVIAAAIGWRLWQYYENDPWTRDGRIKADVIQIAPDVTGQVTKVFVHDNQPVAKGDVLFKIDQARFELALRQAEASEKSARIALAQAIRESQRNAELKDLVAKEVREQGDTRVEQARAALALAIVNRDTARLNLDRTRVVAAVDGMVTNLDLQSGAYVTASKPVMALVDRHSYYVEGYFEETKLPGIHIGDRASVTLMGENKAMEGIVQSIARGIADRERSTSSNLLQNINPAFNWVRLVQRIPVRIAITKMPEDTRLVAGQTVTVEVLGSPAPTAQVNGKQPG